MKLNHWEQMCWAFQGEHPALAAMMAERFRKDREDGFELEPIDDGSEAMGLIESKGFDSAKRAVAGDYFWHPMCAKCDRCRRHRPECGYDSRNGATNLVCNRCAEVVKLGQPNQ